MLNQVVNLFNKLLFIWMWYKERTKLSFFLFFLIICLKTRVADERQAFHLLANFLNAAISQGGAEPWSRRQECHLSLRGDGGSPDPCPQPSPPSMIGRKQGCKQSSHTQNWPLHLSYCSNEKFYINCTFLENSFH